MTLEFKLRAEAKILSKLNILNFLAKKTRYSQLVTLFEKSNNVLDINCWRY